MITIIAIALVTLVGLLFASMALAPLLIESERPPARPRTRLVLVEAMTDRQGEEHPRAA